MHVLTLVVGLARAVLAAAGCAMFPAGVAAQGAVATERAALEALYEATGGADWVDGTNWRTDAPLGRWYGVSTDDRGRVVALDLISFAAARGPGHDGIRSILPADAASLPGGPAGPPRRGRPAPRPRGRRGLLGQSGRPGAR